MAIIMQMHLGCRSVLSSQQDTNTVQLWDRKELLHSRRSDGSFRRSSMTGKLAEFTETTEG